MDFKCSLQIDQKRIGAKVLCEMIRSCARECKATISLKDKMLFEGTEITFDTEADLNEFMELCKTCIKHETLETLNLRKVELAEVINLDSRRK